MPNDEWRTPPEVITQVKLFYGGKIDLDAASCAAANLLIKAEKYYANTPKRNALTQEWNAETVWLNPPYSRIVTEFINKAHTEFKSGRAKQITLLLNADTSTLWYHALASRFPRVITRGRLSFLDEHNKPQKGNRMGQVIFYMGHEVDRFRNYFDRFGLFELPPNPFDAYTSATWKRIKIKKINLP